MGDHILTIGFQTKPTWRRTVSPPLRIQMDKPSIEFGARQRGITPNRLHLRKGSEVDDHICSRDCAGCERHAPRDPPVRIRQIDRNLLCKLTWVIVYARIDNRRVSHCLLDRKTDFTTSSTRERNAPSCLLTSLSAQESLRDRVSLSQPRASSPRVSEGNQTGRLRCTLHTPTLSLCKNRSCPCQSPDEGQECSVPAVRRRAISSSSVSVAVSIAQPVAFLKSMRVQSSLSLSSSSRWLQRRSRRSNASAVHLPEGGWALAPLDCASEYP